LQTYCVQDTAFTLRDSEEGSKERKHSRQQAHMTETLLATTVQPGPREQKAAPQRGPETGPQQAQAQALLRPVEGCSTSTQPKAALAQDGGRNWNGEKCQRVCHRRHGNANTNIWMPTLNTPPSSSPTTNVTNLVPMTLLRRSLRHSGKYRRFQSINESYELPSRCVHSSLDSPTRGQNPRGRQSQ
jgi:hypothetical protein